VGQRGLPVGQTWVAGRAAQAALVRDQSPPQATLLAPVEGGGDRHQVSQDDGIAATLGQRQKQQRFLKMRARVTWPSDANSV
jgi:hypothetical protein